MSKMRKVLFSALAVFAMFTIGALNLSASNVTSEVTESKVEMSAEVTQTPYTGDVYYRIGDNYFLLDSNIDTSHCTLTVTENPCMIWILDDSNNYIEVALYGKDSNGFEQPLFEID